MKKILLLVSLLFSWAILVWCNQYDADVVSRNLSIEADMFKVDRRIVFYNWITWDYMLSIEWRCSLGNYDPTGQLSVTCKVSEDSYKKHFLWLSDNVTYFVEQLESRDVSDYRYKVIFKPQTIIPDVDILIK